MAATMVCAGAAAAGVTWVSCGPVRRPDGGEGLLAVRARAPEFSAPDQDGHTRSLLEFRGRPVVLYFYPRDGTPGGTREACAFRDAWDRIAAAGGQVVGVSMDDVASHARFAREHRLQFPLLSDTSGDILRRYGVRSFLGMASRVTFIVDSRGVIARVYPNVDPAVHVDEVIAALGEATR